MKKLLFVLLLLSLLVGGLLSLVSCGELGSPGNGSSINMGNGGKEEKPGDSATRKQYYVNFKSFSPFGYRWFDACVIDEGSITIVVDGATADIHQTLSYTQWVEDVEQEDVGKQVTIKMDFHYTCSVTTEGSYLVFQPKRIQGKMGLEGSGAEVYRRIALDELEEILADSNLDEKGKKQVNNLKDLMDGKTVTFEPFDESAKAIVDEKGHVLEFLVSTNVSDTLFVVGSSRFIYDENGNLLSSSVQSNLAEFEQEATYYPNGKIKSYKGDIFDTVYHFDESGKVIDIEE